MTRKKQIHEVEFHWFHTNVIWLTYDLCKKRNLRWYEAIEKQILFIEIDLLNLSLREERVYSY